MEILLREKKLPEAFCGLYLSQQYLIRIPTIKANIAQERIIKDVKRILRSDEADQKRRRMVPIMKRKKPPFNP